MIEAKKYDRQFFWDHEKFRVKVTLVYNPGKDYASEKTFVGSISNGVSDIPGGTDSPVFLNPNLRPKIAHLIADDFKGVGIVPIFIPGGNVTITRVEILEPK